ncbi:MAG: hypothetical protein ACPIB4_03585, partial [Candidatus Puniceispirillaceae bacterium]
VRIIAVSFKTDIEIARAAKKKSIFEVGDVLGMPPAELVPFGHDNAWAAKKSGRRDYLYK